MPISIESGFRYHSTRDDGWKLEGEIYRRRQAFLDMRAGKRVQNGWTTHIHTLTEGLTIEEAEKIIFGESFDATPAGKMGFRRVAEIHRCDDVPFYDTKAFGIIGWEVYLVKG